MRSNNLVQINGTALTNALKRSGVNACDVSVEIGYGKTYIGNCVHRNMISVPAMNVLDFKYNIKPSEYVVFDDQEKPEPKEDVMATLNVISQTLEEIKKYLEEICR